MVNYKKTKIGDMYIYQGEKIKYVLIKKNNKYSIEKFLRKTKLTFSKDLDFYKETPTIKMFEERYIK